MKTKNDFKEIAGFEGFYQHNSEGVVKSLDRVVIGSRGARRFYEGQVMKFRDDNRNNLMITLRKDGIRTTKRFKHLQLEYRKIQ